MARRETRKRKGAEASGTRDSLVRFREGDPDAFREIVGAYHERLVQFYFRLCWDRDRAEDFAQELFMKLLRGAHRYRPEGKLSTFVFRVATNLWIDHYRSVRPQPRLYSLDQAVHVEGRPPAGSTPAPGEAPLERVIRDEEKERLRAALEALTEPHRLVFELAVYQEMPYAEIAQVLSIPVGTVKSRMHNSVNALREILGREERRAEEGAGGGDSFRAGGAAG